MNTIRCHNCGETNPAGATFCAKCAAWLKHSNLKQERQSKIFLPPQIERERLVSETPTPRRAGGWWLISIIIVVGLIIWWFISNG